MAPTLVTAIEDEERGEQAASPLSDWQRRRVLIAAAAAAVVGGPVRILDIRPAHEPAGKWARGRLPRSVRRSAWLRRPAAPMRASETEPAQQPAQGDKAL